MQAIKKLNRKIRSQFVNTMRKKKFYRYCYRSCWHLLMHENISNDNTTLYFTACPNPGAGIGHQMANWIAGYWFAKQFGLKYAHIPFTSEKWEIFLGFYQFEETVSSLKKKGYKVVRVQSFDENNKQEVNWIKKIINSYAGSKTIFLAEQDQFYYNQYEIMDVLQKKFYFNPERKNDKLIYSKDAFNIAIHVRRGDIIQKSGKENPNLTIRYQSNSYFVNALKTAFEFLRNRENIHVYLFSQGTQEEFGEFQQFENLHFCLDMGAQESFLHMVFADALITSKSSFSYKPALLNRGIKFSPANFWHGYPNDKNWILLDENGKTVEEGSGGI